MLSSNHLWEWKGLYRNYLSTVSCLELSYIKLDIETLLTLCKWFLLQNVHLRKLQKQKGSKDVQIKMANNRKVMAPCFGTFSCVLVQCLDVIKSCPLTQRLQVVLLQVTVDLEAVVPRISHCHMAI